MTIKLTSQEICELQAARTKCRQDFTENIFFNSSPMLFVQLVWLTTKPDYMKHLSQDIRNLSLKHWLESLFSTDKTDIILDLQDRVALVINGISHLPDCKCKLKGKLSF